MSNIEWKEKRGRVRIRHNLEKEYKRLFRNKDSEIYKEVFEYKSLKKIKNEMNKLLNKLHLKKRSEHSGLSILDNSRILIRDFLNYSFFNGVIIEVLPNTKEIFRDYLEIILICYTNVYEENLALFGNVGRRNSLEKLDYLTLYIMLNLPPKELNNLLLNYRIESFQLEEGAREKLIRAFKNVYRLKKDNKFLEDKLSCFFILFEYLQLEKDEILKIIDLVFKKEFLRRLASDELDNLVYFLNKVIKEVPSKNLNSSFNELIKTKNSYLTYSSGENLVALFTWELKERISEGDKINLNEDEIDEFCKSNFINPLGIKIYFSRVVSEEYKKNIKEILLVQLNTVPDKLEDSLENLKKEIEHENKIILYKMALDEKLIVPFKEFENKILDMLKKKYCEEDREFLTKNFFNQQKLISTIISLNIEGNTSEIFKKKLRSLNNKTLDEVLEKFNYLNLWKYSLGEKNVSFEVKDLKDFTIHEKKEFLTGNDEPQIKKAILKELEAKYDDELLKVIIDSYREKLEKTIY